MDALSEILSTFRLESSFFCRSELTAPWGMSFSDGQFSAFHAVRRGACWVQSADDPPVPLTAGDMIIFPHGGAHVMADEPSTPARDINEIIAEKKADEHTPLVHGGCEGEGGEGAPVTLLCGHFYFDQSEVHPLMSALPPMIRIPGEDGRAAHWLEASLEIIALESSDERPGAAAVINRATDVLIIQFIRAYLDGLSHADQAGWLRGLSDARISRVLAQIHRHPDRDWTVETLASSAGMSRSSFCTLFAELVGEAPHKYLTRWRMHTATRHLKESDLTLPEVAEKVGYRTETSFSKTFKKYVGTAPGTYRRQHRNSSRALAMA